MTTSSNEPSSCDQPSTTTARDGGSASCPPWCRYDHEGSFFAEPGEHARYLTTAHLRNFVSLHTPDDGKSIEVTVWLLGNGVVEIPLDANSGTQLRAWADMFAEAAAELDRLVVGHLLPEREAGR
ncbi:hypothetical protein [Nocardioides sp. W7]|uniref:hypothetical protein n=1 Tax=Nocardioides sp. W7 TaxID=2931390 RepID=UPI001FCFC54A|nr:hypothetical protein [Nocardioides sp. W7]